MKREIEVKYLLDGKAGKKALLEKLKAHFPAHTHTHSSEVISYFYKSGATHEQIIEVGQKVLDEKKLGELKKVLESSDELLVKARSINGKVEFTVKGSAKGDDPVHAVNRIEFEANVDIELEELGQIIDDAGIEIASKWSSKRDFYKVDDKTKMDLEFCSGYGFKAELEHLIDDGESHEDALESINEISEMLNITEASQELFGKMYEYYNSNWRDYFNTDKSFPEDVWKELGR